MKYTNTNIQIGGNFVALLVLGLGSDAKTCLELTNVDYQFLFWKYSAEIVQKYPLTEHRRS